MNRNKSSPISKLFFVFRPHLNLGARLTLSIGLVVGLVSLIVFFSIYYVQQRQVMRQVETEAKSLLISMMLMHEWAANYDGVWTDKPGDTYFAERNGFYQKTPAIVMKELSLLLEDRGFYRFHLTSQHLKNPENAPLPSEETMLAALAMGQPGVGQIEELDGQLVYHYMTPLPTEESCLKCHQEQGHQIGDLRGGLSVFLPMDGVDDTLAQNRLILSSSAALIISLLMVSLYLLVRRLIVRPIAQLKSAAIAVGGGNYQTRCHINTGDELEALGTAINQMVDGLKASRDMLEARVAQRTNELTALSDIVFTISHNQTLQEALNEALETIFEVTAAKSGAIHLLAGDGQGMELVACRGLSPKEEIWLRQLRSGECIPGQAVQTDTFIHQVDLANCNKDGQCNQDCPLGRTGWQLISAPL